MFLSAIEVQADKTEAERVHVYLHSKVHMDNLLTQQALVGSAIQSAVGRGQWIAVNRLRIQADGLFRAIQAAERDETG